MDACSTAWGKNEQSTWSEVLGVPSISTTETDADLCEDYEYDEDNRPSAKKH